MAAPTDVAGAHRPEVVSRFGELDATVARLEARIDALEKKLEERSRFIQAITRELCETDRITVTRLAAGRASLPGADHSLLGFRETAELQPAEVFATMDELWEALRFSVGTPTE